MAAIVALRTHRVTVPLRRPFVTAVRRTDALESLLVEAVDSDGRSGWGESALSWRVTGESAASVEAVVDGPFAAAVVGRPVGDPEGTGAALLAAAARNTAARAGVDAAIWDLAAQDRGIPLHRLLAGEAGVPSVAVRTDMTLSALDEAAVLLDADEQVAAGFRTLKVKVGLDPERDDRVIRALRRGPAADVMLRVDANQGWSAAEAIRLVRGWEDDGIGLEFVEQPTPAGDIAALAEVAAAVTTPVLADESVWDARELREVVRRRAASLVNVKLAKTGGITAARTLAALAAAEGVGVLFGCMMESAVGISAAASLAAALSPDAVHDLDAGLWQAARIVLGDADYDVDRFVLSAAPGLGIAGLAAGAFA